MTTTRPYTLAHPVYLDVPMMVSFLAALEGGVAMSGEETSTETGAREQLLAGKSGLRARLFGFGEASAEMDASRSTRDESSFTSQTQRHHTAASLFNVLFSYLHEDEQVNIVGTPEDLDPLTPGQLIEYTAEYLGNPLEDILGFFDALLPYFDPDPKDEISTPTNGKRSGNPAKKAAATRASATRAAKDDGLDVLKLMAADIKSAPVHDLLFKTTDGLHTVVTVSSEFYNETTKENLRQGQFKIVGKVTRVLGETDSINLTRRTVMGAAGADMAETTIDGFRSIEGFSMNVANPIVQGPAVQVLPMAIFV